MASTHRTIMNSGLLLAIERSCNGGNAHLVRNHAQTYEMACFSWDEPCMNRALRRLESELVKAAYLQERATVMRAASATADGKTNYRQGIGRW